MEKELQYTYNKLISKFNKKIYISTFLNYYPIIIYGVSFIGEERNNLFIYFDLIILVCLEIFQYYTNSFETTGFKLFIK